MIAGTEYTGGSLYLLLGKLGGISAKFADLGDWNLYFQNFYWTPINKSFYCWVVAGLAQHSWQFNLCQWNVFASYFLNQCLSGLDGYQKSLCYSPLVMDWWLLIPSYWINGLYGFILLFMHYRMFGWDSQTCSTSLTYTAAWEGRRFIYDSLER